MSPSSFDLTRRVRPDKGTRIELSKTGAERLRIHSTTKPTELKEGRVLVYPGYKNLDIIELGTIWMETEDGKIGLQVPYSENLFTRTLPSRKESE